jgi:hypothetical protein
MPAIYVETREVPLDELAPFPGNARRGDVAAIQASLRRNGQYRSLIVRDAGTGPLIVLAGNNTLQALQAEGSETARCEVVRCSDSDARRINLADNKLAEMGTYDNDALAELLEGIRDDIDGTGYNSNDLVQILDVELPQGFPTYDESIAAAAAPPAAPVPAAPPAAPVPAPAPAAAPAAASGTGNYDEDEGAEYGQAAPARTSTVVAVTVECPNCKHQFAAGR